MFKLTIECTRDVDELHINFSDGSSVISTSPDSGQKKSPVIEEKQRSTQKQEKYLDVDGEWGGISQEIVEKPVINREDKPVKVAQELQNFDF